MKIWRRVLVVAVLGVAMVAVACVPPPPVDADRDGISPPADCNDADASVYPGAPETPNDGVDSDCDGQDPVVVDPGPANQVLSSEFAESLEFLHSGDGATQVGLDLSAISEPTAAAVRGRVLDTAAQPLGGVRVTVAGRPELGSVTTGDDGVYTLLVPGGADLVVRLEMSGHVVVQREAATGWQDFTVLEDVVLTEVDTVATTVDLDDGVDVTHVASTVGDSDGSRAASLLFRADTTATMTLEDGSTQPLSSMTVRATELTVGGSGPAAMPGELPVGTLYTYAVDVTVDEAEAAGATRVDFDTPVSLAVDNFLGFPVGTPVPVGYYDRQAAAWLPNETQGLVVGVVSVVDGLARVDLDGDGDADGDDDAAASAIGLDDAARASLAARFGAGSTAWWTQLTHFTPFDLNWAPSDLEDNESTDPEEEDEDREEHCEGGSSSIISCSDGSLIEHLDLTGVDTPLVHDSQSGLGYLDGRRVTIPVTGSDVPADLEAVEVITEVAGRRTVERFDAPGPDTVTTFVWDGQDAFGRTVVGAVPITVTTRSLHRVSYSTGPFGAPPVASSIATPVTARDLTPVDQVWNGFVTANARPTGETVGGWTFAQHHRYDPIDGTVYLGDGTERSPDQLDRTSAFWRLTGVGTEDVGERALLTSPEAAAIAIGADGTVYLAEPSRHRIVAIDPSGELVPVAGTGSPGDSGDGGAATSATLIEPAALMVDRDGSLLVADRGAARVRRIAPDGTIRAFAGTGTPGSTGDGGPAVDAQLLEPMSLALVDDGTVMVADRGAGTVRAVSPDGTIRTYAGGGTQTDCSVSCTRDVLDLTAVSDVAVSADGERVAIAAAGVVHEIDTGGLFRTISSVLPIDVDQIAYDGAALWMGGIRGYVRRGPSGQLTSPNIDSDGTGGGAIGGLGGMAAGSRVDVVDLAVTPDGEVVIADSWADGPSGGEGGEGDGGEGEGGGGSVGYDGVLVLSGPLSYAGSSLPPHGPRTGSGPLADGAATLVPSDDGTRIFLFGPTGRHLRTVLSDTLVVEWSFSYDAAGGLVAVTDSAGRTTSIERAGGVPTAVVGPFGQRTTLGVTDGLITSSAGPENRQRTFDYADGQLVGHTDEAGNPASYTYGADGRLTASVATDGTTYSLSHTELPDGRETVLVTGGLDVRTTRSTTNEFNGDRVVTTTLPDGSEHQHATAIDGSTSAAERDNDIVFVSVQAEPRFGPAALVPTSVYIGRGDGFVSDSVSTTYEVLPVLATIDEPLSLSSVQRTAVGSAGETSSSQIDPVARTVVSADASGLVTTVAFDERGLVTDAGDDSGSAATQLDHDANGLLTARTTGDRTTTYVNGSDGLPNSVTVPGGEQRTLDFDDAGRLVSVTDDGGATMSHTYDALDQMTGWTSPEGVARTGTLTAKGRPLTLVGPPDPVVGRTYDAARHPTGVQHGDGTSTVITTADGGKPVALDGPEVDLGITYGSVGSTGTLANVESATWQAPGVLVTTLPDQRGSLLAGTEWIYNNGTVHSERSDVRWSDGRVVQRRVNNANSSRIDFGYDPVGRVIAAGPYSIDRTGPGRSPSSISRGTSSLEMQLDPYGKLASRELVVGTDAVASTALEHDDNGRVRRQTVTVDDQVLLDVTYVRNERGFVTEVRDAADELVESAAYDLDGNRTEATRDGDTVESEYRSDGVIDTHDGDPVTTDGNGMVTGLRGMALDHAVSGELLTATVDGQLVRYGYDSWGRRVARDIGGQVTQYLYGDPTHPGRVTDSVAPNGTVTQYLYDDAGLLFAVRVGGTWYTVVTDAVGSPVAVVDAAGVVVDERLWSMWGEELSDSSAGFELEVGFAGGLQDPLTGLVRFGAREYDPVTGRWLSPDPLGLGGGASNLYRYAEADPVSWRDPSGEVSVGAGYFRGPGAGAELHITPEGMAFCVEVGSGVGGGAGVSFADNPLPPAGDSQQGQVGVGPFTFEIPLTPGFEKPCSVNGVDFASEDPFGSLRDIAEAKDGSGKSTRGAKIKAALSAKVTQKWCVRF